MNLRDQMSGTIPVPLLHLTPKRFDIIGDVAVISIPPERDDFKDEIAKTVVSRTGCPDDQRLQPWSSLPF